jgi:hypothetical protein
LLAEQAICIFGIVASSGFGLASYFGAFFKKENNFWWFLTKMRSRVVFCFYRKLLF